MNRVGDQLSLDSIDIFSGTKRKRDDDDGDVSMQGDDDDSRSGVAVKVEPPKGRDCVCLTT